MEHASLGGVLGQVVMKASFSFATLPASALSRVFA
jgi:hypothetical protein